MSLSDLSGPRDSAISVAQANPSVSKAQWANYALRKLREGYVLQQAPNGRAFHFFRAGEPLLPCATHAARKLIEMGLLTVVKSDVRGVQYALAEGFHEQEGPSA
jgi:hypothetical protein